MQPTDDSLHLGQLPGRADASGSRSRSDHDALYCVVDLHALTVNPDPAVLRERTRRHRRPVPRGRGRPRAVDRCSSSRTSREHAELAWLLSLPDRLRRGRPHDPVQGQVGASRAPTGTDGGPVHLPRAHGRRHPALRHRLVPVGEDQRQHLELYARPRAAASTRASARAPPSSPSRTSSRPSAKIYDLQEPTAKMSKSIVERQGHHRAARGPEGGRQEHQVRRTDSESDVRYDPAAKPGVSNLLTIFSAVTGRGVDEIAADYDGQGLRPPQGGPGRRASSRSSSRSRHGRRPTCRTRRSSTRCWPTAPSARGTSPARCSTASTNASACCREAPGEPPRPRACPGADRRRHRGARALRRGAPGAPGDATATPWRTRSRRTSP